MLVSKLEKTPSILTVSTGASAGKFMLSWGNCAPSLERKSPLVSIWTGTFAGKAISSFEKPNQFQRFFGAVMLFRPRKSTVELLKTALYSLSLSAD